MSDNNDEPPDSQGGRANWNGRRLEELIDKTLRLEGYRYNPMGTLDGFKGAKVHLFAEDDAGQFAKHCAVPLVSHCHAGRNRVAEVDYVVLNKTGDFVLLSIKSQEVGGSADEKLEYEIQQLISAELPAAILIHGDGWRKTVLGPIFDRAWARSHRLFLFRDHLRLGRWIHDGLPVGGKGTTPADVFAQYCSREP